MAKLNEAFYRSSPEYIDRIDPSLRQSVITMIEKLPQRKTQGEINNDIVWLLAQDGWYFSGFPQDFPEEPPQDLGLANVTSKDILKWKSKDMCKVTTTLDLDWTADFAKEFGEKRVVIEVQFGKIEAAFRDFCRFAITFREGRLDLGILVLMIDPNAYFTHRKTSISGMADYETLKKTMFPINLECPLWLIGIR